MSILLAPEKTWLKFLYTRQYLLIAEVRLDVKKFLGLDLFVG